MDHSAESSQTFVLGVNDWPRKKAMYWWNQFRPRRGRDRVRPDRGHGVAGGRVLPFWEDFQPAPDGVSDRALADLGVVLDVATEAGLRVMPTFFTGNMSGICWWPSWALLDREDPTGVVRYTNGAHTLRAGRDPYADPLMLEAERLQVEAVCSRYGGHPAILLLELLQRARPLLQAQAVCRRRRLEPDVE